MQVEASSSHPGDQKSPPKTQGGSVDIRDVIWERMSELGRVRSYYVMYDFPGRVDLVWQGPGCVYEVRSSGHHG